MLVLPLRLFGWNEKNCPIQSMKASFKLIVHLCLQLIPACLSLQLFIYQTLQFGRFVALKITKFKIFTCYFVHYLFSCGDVLFTVCFAYIRIIYFIYFVFLKIKSCNILFRSLQRKKPENMEQSLFFFSVSLTTFQPLPKTKSNLHWQNGGGREGNGRTGITVFRFLCLVGYFVGNHRNDHVLWVQK